AGGAAGRGGTSAGGASVGGASVGGASVGGASVGGASVGGASVGGRGGASSCSGTPTSYDELVLCDSPVGYWAMSQASGSEPDLSGRGNVGSYRGGSAGTTTLPNGDRAAVFNGSNQFLTIPSLPAYSIPTTGSLTWEAWLKASVLQFPHDSGGYVDWLGKCASYSPTCEWEGRLYNTDNSESRCNRFSAYVFNPSAGLGSGADFQPQCGLIQAGNWYHVVGEYTLLSAPASCENTSKYPGSIDIWVNGVKWNQSRHGQTGCMSQYQVVPKANSSPINVGTMAEDAWFQGAIAKLAIYDHLLSEAQIKARYRAMTAREPTGSCANDCSF
ncbi:MAG TPA: LamG-like jellyroll fold domain-containing protein, partial [Polyangiaceae bacterium]|nr:LamG-like jellyroll fold domain-containing protein [Polyangiaceae bacterium]